MEYKWNIMKYQSSEGILWKISEDTGIVGRIECLEASYLPSYPLPDLVFPENCW